MDKTFDKCLETFDKCLDYVLRLINVWRHLINVWIRSINVWRHLIDPDGVSDRQNRKDRLDGLRNHQSVSE